MNIAVHADIQGMRIKASCYTLSVVMRCVERQVRVCLTEQDAIFVNNRGT